MCFKPHLSILIIINIIFAIKQVQLYVAYKQD